MAILVVLSFEDDEQAKTLVQDMLNYPESRLLTPSQENDVEAKVIAAYKQPTKFHGAFETHGARKTQGGWTMGTKWGWWVCAVCKMPSELYWESIFKQSSFGKNILHLLAPKKEEEGEEENNEQG